MYIRLTNSYHTPSRRCIGYKLYVNKTFYFQTQNNFFLVSLNLRILQYKTNSLFTWIYFPEIRVRVLKQA